MTTHTGKKVVQLIGLYTLIAAAAVLLNGCSAKVSGASPEDIFGHLNPGPQDFAHLVPGPDISGTWDSECVENSRDDGWMTVRLTVEGQQVTRDTTTFNNSQCNAPADSGRSEHGYFRYTKVNAFNALEVEYKFDMNGGSYTQFETMKLDGANLLISGEIGGDSDPQIKMVKTGGAPQPSPTPGNGEQKPQPVGNHVPKYGDYLVFSGSYYGVAQLEEYGNNGYDEHDAIWTVSYKITGGQTDMGYSYYSKLTSSADTKQILENCAAKGGKREVVKVKAGTFDSCKIDDGARTKWFADVPLFGTVKVENDNGSYKGELQDYHWADSSQE
jgi:hypothetical protein